MEKMIAGGSCITRIDGKAVFVPFTLPGETIDLEITEDRKDYSFARVESVRSPSPKRVVPACPVFGKCGGCTLQMTDNAYQSELRLSIFKDILFRAHVQSSGAITIESGEPVEYRSRFQFHRTQNGKIGFKAAESSEIVPLNDCVIAVPEIRKALQDGSLEALARHYNAGDRFHVFAYQGKLYQEDDDTKGEVDILGVPVRFDVRGFFQSNIPLLERLISSVCRIDSPEPKNRLLDFYSGVGTFSIFAGKHFKETVLVEQNSDSLAIARENLEMNKIKGTFCAVSDEKWPERKEAKLSYDVAIIDPPRQGLSKKSLEWFIASGIPELRYVSCDPVTFARDAVRLIAAGYTLSRVTLYDFYPQTHHIETAGFFIR